LTSPMTDETPDDRIRRLITAQFKKQLPRKFYKTVEVSENNGILLDGKPVKTPLKSTLVMSNCALAQAVAAEWTAQDKVIDPETMPLTKLANTALDRATAERDHVVDEIVQYAGSDLVCYWADRPPDLVALQSQHWQPVLDWAVMAMDAHFTATAGVVHHAQSAAALNAVRARVENFDPWELTGLYLLTTLTGSVLVSLMMQTGALTSESAWACVHLDEDYQIAHWGEDAEAMARRASRKREFEALVRYFTLLKSGD
jgi:chaperone required for assembly of F1-ATPase